MCVPQIEAGKSVSVEYLVVPVKDSDTTRRRGKQRFHLIRKGRRRSSRHQAQLGGEQLPNISKNNHK